MLPLNHLETHEIDHQDRVREAEHQRLVNLAMEGQPRQPGIISRWLNALKSLATLRATVRMPQTRRPVALAHESGSFRIR